MKVGSDGISDVIGGLIPSFRRALEDLATCIYEAECFFWRWVRVLGDTI